MSAVEEFAHGSYGDYSGVVFCSSPEDGRDRLALSNIYIGPLFRAVLDRAWRENGGEQVPRLASEWNTLTGWAACGEGRVLIPPEDAADLVAAFEQVTVEDLAPHCAGCTPKQCFRCVAVIRDYISARLASGAELYIEDD